MSRRSATTPDPFLLSRKFCIAWTAVGIIWLFASINALLRQRNSALSFNQGIQFGEVDALELLVLAVPLLIGLQALFAYLTALHARARIAAGRKPAFPPAFCIGWYESMAVGIGRTFVWSVIVVSTILVGVLIFRLLEQPVYDSALKPPVRVQESFQSILRLDLLNWYSFRKGYFYLGDPKGPTFYPVAMPILYCGVYLWSLVVLIRIGLSHRGRFGSLNEYSADRQPD